ncbi:hypothetical protein CUJ89_08635 [Burkholderia pyrrocinia]|uniref:Phage gp6-like head-tail connector protein n=1 Tax=Burkholderia pyrrocinia TaxID=60550 RepID=A0A2Z5MTI7_BURPY|nr:hypothetical protein [Burkholderia pyrrocinia]AXF20541.1 hypothetical protein CUJ89_08635 [Burkholderia pyrrocinia]
MGAVLVEYVNEAEPLTFEDVASQCRIDDDDEREFIEQVVIPGVRQAAESRSGAAIRKARYLERLGSFPKDEISLSVGQVFAMDAVAIRSMSGERSTLSEAQFELIQLGRETLLAPVSGHWPAVGAPTLTYRAGIDLDRFPSVRSWMLLAAAWAYENRELFSSGQSVVAMPGGFADALLNPITVPPRF